MSYEEHKQKSRALYIKGQTYIGLGFLMFMGGFYLLFSDYKFLEYSSYAVIPLGIFILVRGGVYHNKHNEEEGYAIDALAYAAGHTEESWQDHKNQQLRKSQAEDEEREKLAQAIARELRK